MLNYSNIRKGATITNENGTKYEVLATRKDRNGQQDLLLRNKKYGDVVVGKAWDCRSHKDEKVGTWGQGDYLGKLSTRQLENVTKAFKGCSMVKKKRRG